MDSTGEISLLPSVLLIDACKVSTPDCAWGLKPPFTSSNSFPTPHSRFVLSAERHFTCYSPSLHGSSRRSINVGSESPMDGGGPVCLCLVCV
jgi:hypothetical protein